MILSKFQLTNRVAVVTGAGKGIGKGIALGLAEAGAHVVVVARTVEHIEATAAEVRARGRRALALSADVRNSDQVQAVMEKTYYTAVAAAVDTHGQSPWVSTAIM